MDEYEWFSTDLFPNFSLPCQLNKTYPAKVKKEKRKNQQNLELIFLSSLFPSYQKKKANSQMLNNNVVITFLSSRKRKQQKTKHNYAPE